MRWLLAALIGLAIVGGVAAWAAPRLARRLTPIKVGLLHSRSGSLQISEESMIEAELLAIEEINASGGLLGGRRVEPVIADGRSDFPTFAREAEGLIQDKKVSAIFGCWASASRKSVKPVVEQHHHLLFYPTLTRGWRSRRTSSTPARRPTSRSSRRSSGRTTASRPGSTSSPARITSGHVASTRSSRTNWRRWGPRS